MTIEFKRLSEANPSDIIELMNNPLVRRQMPLSIDNFNQNDCELFIAAKEKLWEEHGYGPWAFFVDNEFAGWGGLQPEKGEADLALVLHPSYWGIGKVLYKKILQRAFIEMEIESITVLLPPTRTRIQGLLRMGFKEDGTFTVGETQFIRFRLNRELM